MKISFSTPSQTGIWNWLFYSWNFPSGRRGPYIQVRIVGFRVLGLEIEWKSLVSG